MSPVLPFVLGVYLLAAAAWLMWAARRRPVPPRLSVHVCDREGRETSCVTSESGSDETLAVLIALEMEGHLMLHRERNGRPA